VRNYAVWISLAILVLIPLSGCTKPAVDEVSLNAEFTISAGQSVSVKGENLSIKFVEVISDSRCPTGATCIWAGEASSLIEITDSASTYRKVLTEPGSSSPTKADFTGYEVMFNLLPYPVLGKETKAKDYLLQLIVSKTP
jgi:hypothetical protein